MRDERSASDCYVVAHGRLDASTVEGFEQELQKAIEAALRCVVVDCAAVTHISSSAMRVLLMAHRAALAKGCLLQLESVAPRVMRVLALAGFDQIFSFRDDETGGNSP